MAALVTLLGVAVGLLAVLVVALLRTHAEILRRLHQLGVNLDPERSGARTAPAPPRSPRSTGPVTEVKGMTPAGRPLRVVLTGTSPTLVAFLSSGCMGCREFWSGLGDRRRTAELVPGNGVRPVVVVRGAESESPAAIAQLAPPEVPTVMSSEAWEAFAVPGSPWFVLLDGPSGSPVASGTATTWSQLGELLAPAQLDS